MKAEISKSLITVQVDTIRELEDVTTVAELQAYVDEIKEIVPPEYINSTNIKIRGEEYGLIVYVTYKRRETPEERSYREAEEAQVRNKKEVEERILLKRLQKKYGKEGGD